ncbi:exosortase system-associated protein, TIGR04073 family [Tichowtungia aerotolerans]|uniref:Exosortase system-associated protein, TIGR04073 family n=1 Tax=Tichowtungia aerotolerans TaxID=2697043 RepID=A0A6P1MAX9_9BACT|nr:exosortase system-associated protein, TIGR04073 family [Tichowtungia aerotolerans]QHI70263.1 exosortase system-associated protein, TIGR04073 family [Tichowtungia aerotolerans]
MRFLAVLAVVVFACFRTAPAEEVAGHKLSEAEEIVQDMSSKLNRGVVNILTGWGEIPRQMIKSGKNQGWWAALPVGLPSGAIMTVVRTGTGVFETVTFMVPINDSYGPLIDPGFVWQKVSE